MEFTEFWKQQKRMCKFYNGECRENHCELHGLEYNVCILSIKNNPKEAEEIVDKWASEHPIQTNADKFEEVFGIESNRLCITKNCKGNCDKCYFRNWWEKEYIIRTS